MLVLSRRETERIRLGDSIVVTVVRIKGDRVRLGIEAPASMLVLRDELDELPPSLIAVGDDETDATDQPPPMADAILLEGAGRQIEFAPNQLASAAPLMQRAGLGDISPLTSSPG